MTRSKTPSFERIYHKYHKKESREEQQEDKGMSTERVPTRQAAQEMGIGMDQLRWMMETRKIDIGVVMPSRTGRTKRYLVFRSKLDKVLGKGDT